MKNNIVLIGFMGSGKSTVGMALAQKLGYGFVDCDDEIEKKTQMSIPHIFEQHGEALFRTMERDAILAAAGLQRHVIATGGGAVKNSENMGCLRQTGVLVYLKAAPEKLYANTQSDANRPLLNTPDRLETIRRLLAEREPLYKQNADIVLDVTEMDIPGIVNAAIERIGAYCGALET